MRLKRNARGGYIAKIGGERDPIPEEKRAEVYGPSTQCPDDACGHRLTERHWHPVNAKHLESKAENA